MRMIVGLLVLMGMTACTLSHNDRPHDRPVARPLGKNGPGPVGHIVEDDAPNPAIDNSIVQNFSSGLTFKILDIEKLKSITGYNNTNMMIAGEAKPQRRIDGVF